MGGVVHKKKKRLLFKFIIYIKKNLNILEI